ncbi:MAG: type II secretion system protein [Nitrospinae bacterium]|nr:type II secretion system protein [Nitrospinota bacterium]
MLNRILEAVRKALNNKGGFTLIELIMVIVILGILAAAAVPKFMDLSTDAKKAAVKGMASAMQGAGSANFAAWKVGSAKKVTVANCAGVSAILDGGLPKDSTGTAVVVADVTPGSTATDTASICSVTGDGQTVQFSLLLTL